jgi:hypothetical protein
MELKSILLSSLLKRLLLLPFMLFCTWIFYLNAQQQEKLYEDHMSVYQSIVEADTANLIPLNIQYKVVELERDMNANVSSSMAIFLFSIGITITVFIYTVGYSIYWSLQKSKHY